MSVSCVIGHDYDDVYVLYFELSERRGTSTVQTPVRYVARFEPWLSSCRAVEALSRLRRAAVEAVVEALPVEPCRACRVPVEPVEADSMRRRVELLSRAVKFLCRGCRVMSECAVELQLEHGM